MAELVIQVLQVTHFADFVFISICKCLC